MDEFEARRSNHRGREASRYLPQCMGAETRWSDDSELPGELSISGRAEWAGGNKRALVRVTSCNISGGGLSSQNAFRCMAESTSSVSADATDYVERS